MQMFEMNSMTAATGKICWPVLAFWCSLPLTESFMASFCGLGMASAEAMQGPQGQKLSCHLPCSQSKKLSFSRFLRPGLGWNLRSEISLMTV